MSYSNFGKFCKSDPFYHAAENKELQGGTISQKNLL